MLRRSALVGMTAFVLGLGAAPAWAQDSRPADIHRLFVFLHIFGAIIFMGNIVVSAMWMAAAKRARSTAVLHFATRALVRADWMFTLPGVILILGTGLMSIGVWGGFGRAHWAEMGLALFILSGIIWLTVLIPLQKKMVRLTSEAVELNIGLSDDFHRVHRRWAMWGGISTLLPFVSLYLMVFKPTLWG